MNNKEQKLNEAENDEPIVPLKLIGIDYFGKENIFKIFFEDVTPPEQIEQNKTLGFPTFHKIGHLKIDEKIVYSTSVEKMEGCSRMRSSTSKKLVQNCVNYWVEHYVV